MNSEPLHSFPAESYSMRALAWPVLLIPVLGFACFFAMNLAGLFIGVVLISIGYFITTRLVNDVCFYETEVRLNYFFYKKVVILNYDAIKLVRPTTEPKTWQRIFVADMKKNERVKKFTWNCSDEEFLKLKPLLLKNKVRINRKE